MSACRGCDVEVLWAVTAAGRPMPLNAAPDPGGNVVLTGTTRVADNGRSGPGCDVIGPPGLFPDDRERYMPHHATCENVEVFR